MVLFVAKPAPAGVGVAVDLVKDTVRLVEMLVAEGVDVHVYMRDIVGVERTTLLL